MSGETAWQPPDTWRAPRPAEVHLWRTGLDLPDDCVADLRQLLSPDEQLRADRFRFERDRRRYVTGRGSLRRLLGRCVGEEPGRLRFHYGAMGKPLAVEGAPQLRFNLSHSQGLALYAVACGRELGVDIEALRPLADAENIARRFFSASESAALRRLPEPQRIAGFFNCWTRKEAWLKAVGDGLSRPLSDVDVSLVPGEPARILRVQDDPEGAGRWSLYAFEPFPGSVGALCVEVPRLRSGQAQECRLAFFNGRVR
jgi:4'-phosphopantetheinyl transferase